MNVAEITEAVNGGEITVSEAEGLVNSIELAVQRANKAYIDFFERGDRVELENEAFQYGTVVRRNKLTVSVASDEAEDGTREVIQVEPGNVLRVVDVLDDPEDFNYWDYFTPTAAIEAASDEA